VHEIVGQHDTTLYDDLGEKVPKNHRVQKNQGLLQYFFKNQGLLQCHWFGEEVRFGQLWLFGIFLF
jgi:hypothetical protein